MAFYFGQHLIVSTLIPEILLAIWVSEGSGKPSVQLLEKGDIRRRNDEMELQPSDHVHQGDVALNAFAFVHNTLA